jgi:hypothetical protein
MKAKLSIFVLFISFFSYAQITLDSTFEISFSPIKGQDIVDLLAVSDRVSIIQFVYHESDTMFGLETEATEEIQLHGSGFYISGGIIGLEEYQSSLYCEHRGRDLKDKGIFLIGRIGAGLYDEVNFGRGSFWLLQVGMITGRNAHHFELFAGPVYLAFRPKHDMDIEHKVLTGVGLGWRFQKPAKPIIIRSGISFPEGVYFSLGFAIY